jgi:CrcB protein
MHPAITNSLLVGTGGFVGSILRYLIDALLRKASVTMPLGTLAANVLGCFVIGIVCHTVPAGRALSENMKLLIAVGFCGGLTTASSLISQTAALHRAGNSAHAAGYLALTLLATFLAFYGGLYASKLVIRG